MLSREYRQFLTQLLVSIVFCLVFKLNRKDNASSSADKVALFTTQILYTDKKSHIETAREPRRAGGLYSNVYDFASIMSALRGIMKPLIGGQEERQTNDGPVLGDDVRNFPNDSCILYILRSWRLVPPTRVKHLY